MSCQLPLNSGTGNLMCPMAVTCSHGVTMHPLILGSPHGCTVKVGKLTTYGERETRLKKLQHGQFLGIPLRNLRTRQPRGQGWGHILGKRGKTRIFCCQQRNPFLQAYLQFNEIGKFLESKLKCQNRIQWHFQYPLQDMGMFRNLMEMLKVHMVMLKDHIFQWKEWLSFKGLFIVHFTVVLGALFLCAQAGAQAYIERRVLPSVSTAIGESLGRKLNLGRVQKLSLLRGALSLESCSLGPHSEEFSCGELPNVRLQLRPLASLQQRQWVIKAVLVQPHILITQKEDWTWLGIPTPLEKPLEKHPSNEEGIDLRTKARRLAREQAAIQSAEERNKLARKWAQEGYIFADIEEPRSLDKDTAMQAEEMVNSDSMNCTEEESTLERGFDIRETGIEEQLHRKCLEGICNESGLKGPEWKRDFEHDSLDLSFALKMSVSNVKLWLKENMVSPLLHQFRRSTPNHEYFCQKVAMQRRNLDYSAAAARAYFENLDKSKISDAEDGGGDTGKFGTAEDSQKEMEETDEENSKFTGIKHLSTDSIGLSLMRLKDVSLLDRGVVGEETNLLDQSPKHSSTNGIDNGKGSVYEAVVEPTYESCETNKLCKSSENHCERRGKELVNVKCMSEKISAHYSNNMDIVLQKIAGRTNDNHLEDDNIERRGPYANICDNSLEELHGKVSTTETNREREGKEWSDSDITWGSSPVLASLRASRDMTQAKSTVDKSTQFHILKGSLMTSLSDNFITFVQRMDRYIRNNFKQLAAEPESGDQNRVCIGGSEQLLPVYIDSVFFRGGTLMLLGYGDNEPRVMENINGHLKFRKEYEQMHLQLTGRPKEWRTGYPSKDGGKLFINTFVDFLQQEWHVNIKARDLFAPLFERLLEIPIVWANGRATGEVHICMSTGDHFPNLHGQLDVRGLEFQVLDTPSSFSALSGSLCFQGQRIFLHNASCIFGEVPLEASGDFGINPEDGEYHLLCQVPIVEVNALMRTLKARPSLYPIAGSLKAVFNCQGPMDVPIFVGSAVVSKKNDNDLNMPSSVASESVRLNKDNGAVAAFDRVPFSYMSANFTFNTDNCMADLYGIQATLVDGGEIRGAGNAWICPEGDLDDNAVDVNFSGNVLFDNVLRHYTSDGIQKLPVKLGDVNIEAKVFGSILRPSYDIKWTAPKAEGSFTDAHGEIIISDEAITISSSSSTFDLLTKIEIAYPNLLYSENNSSDFKHAFAPDIRSVDADLRLRGFDILGLFPFAPIGSSKPMHMKLTGRTKFEGHVVKSLERSVNEKVAWQDDCVGMKASGLVGEVHLSGIKLNQLLVAPQLTGSLDISPQSFKLDATGRPDENLLIEIIGGLHLAGSETSLYDLVKRKVSLSLQKGQLRTNIFFQPGHLASLELRHLQLDELELASLRGMVQKAEIQLNFQKRRGQGNLSVMRPRFSGVQGESLDLSARWSGDVELFMQGVQNVGFHAENLKKQLEAAQGYKCVPTDEETPEAIPLPGLAELKGRWHGNFDASGGGNGDTTADFDFHGEDWEWGTYKTQRVLSVGSYSNNDGLRLDKIFIQRDKATLHADGTILGPRPNLHFAVLNFPVGLVPTLLEVCKSSSMNPVPSSWTPLTPIRGILHMEGDLRGSPGKPQCDVQVRLLDGAIGGVDLRRAEVVTSITSTNRFVFDANFEPVIHTGHVHVIGSLPMAPLGTDALVEEDIERESARPMWVVRWMQDKGKITDRIDVDNKFGRERGEEGWEVQLTENLKGLDWNLRETGAVKVDATVKDGGMMLITALSPYAHWLQGNADITLQVRGTVDQPIFDGAATFHRASVSSPVLPTPLSNFGGTFHVKSNQLCINGLEGRVGRKGRLLFNGSLPLRSSKTYSGDKIEMKTENLEVRAKNLFSGQVDSQIEVTGSILEPDVSGMIKFSRGEAYLPQEKRTGAAIARLASNNKNLSTSSRSQMKAARNIVGFYATQSSPLPVREPDTKEKSSRGNEQSISKPQVAIHLRGLKLHLGPELRIVYPLILNFAVSGELELNGLADPKLIKPQGTLTFEDGDVTLLATQVRVKRDHPNRAKFEPDQGLDPTLDLALVGADWQLKVQGRASNWQDNLVVTSPRSGDHDVLTQDEAARVFESQLAESLLEGDGQLAFQKLAAATLENLMPRIEVSREFGQARWRLVSAPQIPNLLSLDPTVDLFKSLANLSIGAEVEVQLGKHLQASVVRQLKESEMATQWTLLYQLTSRLRILFQSTPPTGNRLLFQYTATSQN
ncbi:protein SUBSTANDARD STARCH GRAIN 4, chloroplastic isoform X2 [Cryptomeria japonica]|uniref:protein SUBSTANDARD STARCH GRAIN 4, chloroplastic isoform X2 n=1 Tax=Cryptomeria japonica TaxID=3369 RepID=UPI0027DA16D8|nr:protein SUBSTANDARD STARCH GRAIN 4, chloroplastic isoform X2 [Cryptomeria japonica]